MTNTKYIITYSILTLLFSSIFVACYVLGKGIDDVNSRIDGLKTSIEIYKSAEKDNRNLVMMYMLKNSNLETTIHERDNKIKELTKEVEESNIDESDLRIMAQLIEAESGNQPFEGKLAVGTVVMNRIQSDKFPDTIRDVIFQKGQFSVVANGKIYNEPSDDALKAAKEIMNGTRVLNENVLYFYNPRLTSSTNWVRKLKVDRIIKDHAFGI